MKDKNSFVIKPTGSYKEIAEIEYQSVDPLSCQNIRDLLLQYGPMVIDIWGDNSNNLLKQIGSVRNYFSIIRQPSFGTYQNGNKVKEDHDVLLVGYGINSQNQKYWILQNSWGSNWAYKGFFGILDDGIRQPKEYFKHLAYVKNIDLTDVTTKDIKQSVGKSSQTVRPINLNLRKSVVIENYNDGIITETGSIPPPAGNNELNTFYSMLQTVPAIKRSGGAPSEFRKNLCWANNQNPLNKSIVTPTKSQGACGSCWIFAAMGMMQSAISKEKKGNKLFSLSEQWVLNSIEDANKKGLPGWSNGSGCLGGNTDRFKISINGFNNYGEKYGSFGLKSEKDCPYNCQGYYQGDTNCADGNKCGPPIKQSVQRTDDVNTPPFVKSLKKLWKDNSTYIIIGIAVILVIIIIFSMKK